MTERTLFALSLEVFVLVSPSRAWFADALAWWAPCSEWADLRFCHTNGIAEVAVVSKLAFHRTFRLPF